MTSLKLLIRAAWSRQLSKYETRVSYNWTRSCQRQRARRIGNVCVREGEERGTEHARTRRSVQEHVGNTKEYAKIRACHKHCIAYAVECGDVLEFGEAKVAKEDAVVALNDLVKALARVL